MDSQSVRQICQERLGIWTEDLVADHATPVLVLGIGHDHARGKMSLCVPEGTDDERIFELLLCALQLMVPEIKNLKVELEET